MNLRVAVEQFLQHLQASGFSCHTIRSYRHDLARLIEFIGPAQNVRRIEAPDLSR
ncbi:MAG: site-specific integrase, partial [Nitrospiraceae bacterium]|nr:site-specific integrase [Nitrospiraceae bacterium]